MASDEYHLPVMEEEVAGLFRPIETGVVVDATFGGGGHTRRLSETMGENVRFVGIDRDPAAAANAAELDVTFVAGDFGDLDRLLDEAGIGEVAGVLFDLGISSHQVDVAARGFSYHQEGPLDMRMDPTSGRSAADVVNGWDRRDLARAIRTYGEERHADRIAAAIVAARPLHNTTELATVVAAAVPAAARRAGHPARKTFQAIRIVVNGELESLERGLDAAIDRLRPGGRCAVISYHSLEDRIVKRRFAAGARGCTCPPDLPVCGCGATPELRILTRHPVLPTPAEVERNPRSRSAKLRAAERAVAA